MPWLKLIQCMVGTCLYKNFRLKRKKDVS